MTFTGLVHDLQQRELTAWNKLAEFATLYGNNDWYTSSLRTKWVVMYHILLENGIPLVLEGRAEMPPAAEEVEA